MTAVRKETGWAVDFWWKLVNGTRAGTSVRIRRKSPVDTRRGAEEYERLLRKNLLAGLALDGSDPDQKVAPLYETYVDDWLETYVATNNKPSTIATQRAIVRDHLKPSFGELRLDEIDILAIERFKSGMVKAGLSAKTVNNTLSCFRKSLVCAAEWKLIEHVPPVKWLKVTPPEFYFFSYDDGERLLAAAPPAHRPILATALKAGLRRGELLALRWEDIDLVARKILVRRSVWRGKISTPKSGLHREVALSPQLATILQAHKHLRGPLVFCNEDGSMLTKDMVKRIVPGACRRAGLRYAQWHMLRHSFASQLVVAGVPLKAVQELLGHTTIEMTMRYAHLSRSTLEEAVARLDRAPAFGQPLGNPKGGGAQLTEITSGK